MKCFLKHIKGLAYFLAVLSFSLISSCNEEEIILPEGWENIPGVYEGELSKENKYPPHDRIYIRSINATVSRINDYYSIEFEKNNSIQIPILNLDVIGSEYHSIYFDMKETQGYGLNKTHFDNNHFKIVLDSPFYPEPEIRIRLKLFNSDYKINFNGKQYL